MINRECLSKECDRIVVSKGYCNKHYQQVYNNGRLTPESEYVRQKRCSAHNCKEKHFAKGFCYSHYNKNRYKGNIPKEDTKEDEKKYYTPKSLFGEFEYLNKESK